MDTIITVVGGIAKAVAIFGGTLAAVFVAYAGILWMIAAGDPQRMVQARSALIGAVVGLIIVGVSFLIPPTVSELVIEPAGGVAIESVNSFDCDGMLKAQVVSRRWANNPPKMQRIITEIQVKQDECSSERWAPVVKNDASVGARCFTGVSVGHATEPLKVGQLIVPTDLSDSSIGPTSSRRDSRNDVMVYWTLGTEAARPADGSNCWMYVSAFGAWAEGYQN